MNRNRRITVALTLGILVLVTAAGWNVLAGDDWPPEPYQTYSPEGTWIERDNPTGPGGITVVTCSPADPRTGMGFSVRTDVDVDPTLGGRIPEATSWSSWFFTGVRIGPNSGRAKGVCYVKKDQKPQPKILAIMIVEFTSTITAPDTMDYQGTGSLYDPAADKDRDGLPDTGEPPLLSWPTSGRLKRL
jgi:hypothetical protein